MTFREKLQNMYKTGINTRQEQYIKEYNSDRIEKLTEKFKEDIITDMDKIETEALKGRQEYRFTSRHSQYREECTDLEKVARKLTEEKYLGLRYSYTDNFPPSCIVKIHW